LVDLLGSHRLQEIHFKKRDSDVVQYIRPDIVLCEGENFFDNVDYPDILYLASLAEHPKMDERNNGAMEVDWKYAIHFGKNNSDVFATGTTAAVRSFINDGMMYWTRDVKFNIENGFYAALAMADKSIWFN